MYQLDGKWYYWYMMDYMGIVSVKGIIPPDIGQNRFNQLLSSEPSREEQEEDYLEEVETNETENGAIINDWIDRTINGWYIKHFNRSAEQAGLSAWSAEYRRLVLPGIKTEEQLEQDFQYSGNESDILPEWKGRTGFKKRKEWKSRTIEVDVPLSARRNRALNKLKSELNSKGYPWQNSQKDFYKNYFKGLEWL